MKKIIGKVSESEKAEIQHLYERKNGLIELSRIISNGDDSLYEKVIKDLGETSTRFQNWWNETSSKYQWESVDNGHWEINFDTCEVYLIIPDKLD